MNKEQTATISSKSEDIQLAKVQKLVLEQYPFLSNIRESMLVTDCDQPDCPIIYANDDFEKMTLYPKVGIF